MTRLTLQETNDLFGNIDGMTGEARDRQFASIRAFFRNGLLQSPARQGVTARFGLVEVCRIRLLCEALAIGVHLAPVARFVDSAPDLANPAPSMRVPGGIESRGGLADAVRGVAAGEQWEFRLWHFADGSLRGGFEWCGAGRNAAASAILDSAGKARARSVIVISANELFGQIIAEFAR